MAATNVTGSVNFQASFTEIIPTTAGIITQLNLPVAINQLLSYGNGTATGQVDLIYGKTLALAATPTTLDLTSLTDLNGAALNFARIRELIIVNLAVTAGYTLIIGGAGSNAWDTGVLSSTTYTATLQPSVGQTVGNATLHWSDPWSVGATTGGYVGASHKLLKLDPSANTLNAYVLLVGCSATS